MTSLITDYHRVAEKKIKTYPSEKCFVGSDVEEYFERP